jgi:hypothetical protein
MSRSIFRVFFHLFSAFLAAGVCMSADPQATPGLDRIVPPSTGSRALDLKVSTGAADSANSASGESTVNLEAPEGAHVAALFLSPSGEIIVVFPNRNSPDSLLASGRQFTLFGPESDLKLQKGDIAGHAELAVLVSYKPFRLDPWELSAGEIFKTIRPSAERDLAILKDKLAELARDEGYNTKMVTLEHTVRPVIRLRIMGTDPRKFDPDGKNKSKKPAGVLGAQGIKDSPESPDKK